MEASGAAGPAGSAGTQEVIRPAGQTPPPVDPPRSFSAAGSSGGTAAGDAPAFDYALADEDG
ncbi:hypothetical protein [Actinomyces ruminis]|uniref:hypothetical protein n=1 Tax=Actinomyces ruminis TaxID=1937003 RepID=UPI00211F468E|nr:hypothetical protein [Actinomyces ruminis]